MLRRLQQGPASTAGAGRFAAARARRWTVAMVPSRAGTRPRMERIKKPDHVRIRRRALPGQLAFAKSGSRPGRPDKSSCRDAKRGQGEGMIMAEAAGRARLSMSEHFYGHCMQPRRVLHTTSLAVGRHLDELG